MSTLTGTPLSPAQKQHQPPGEHHQLEVFLTENEAKEVAEPRAEAPPRKRRSLIADVERDLRQRGIPYVAVNETKKALFVNVKLKTFHFVVYDKTGDNWLLWCGEPRAAVRKNMTEWAGVFGEGFRVAYAVRRAGGIVYKTASGLRLTLNGEAAHSTSSGQ